MVVNIDCMQAIFLCSIIDSRIDKVLRQIDHYEERRSYISEETYIEKIAYYKHELRKIASLRESLSKAVSLMSISDILREEFGIDTESIVALHTIDNSIKEELYD